MTDVHVAVVVDALNVDAVQNLVRSDKDGAVCSFVGFVRDNALGRKVTRLDYEAYQEMAEREMREIGMRVLRESGARAIAMYHRVGSLNVGEAAVVVSVASAHRAEAFTACSQAIDAVKATVPIWKREHGVDGAVWVGDNSESCA